MSKSLPRPKGHHVVVPAAVIPGAAGVISFLEKAFGGEVVDRYDGPGGAVLHAEVMLGDSVLMLGEPQPAQAARPASLSFYVKNGPAVDDVYRRAINEGATAVSEPTDQPWGYRSGCVTDPGGNQWTICAVVEEVTREEILQRMQAMMK
jgi:PhnB protein